MTVLVMRVATIGLLSEGVMWCRTARNPASRGTAAGGEPGGNARSGSGEMRRACGVQATQRGAFEPAQRGERAAHLHGGAAARVAVEVAQAGSPAAAERSAGPGPG